MIDKRIVEVELIEKWKKIEWLDWIKDGEMIEKCRNRIDILKIKKVGRIVEGKKEKLDKKEKKLIVMKEEK